MNDEQKIPESKEIKSKKSAAYAMLFELGLEFAVMMALPLLVFIYLGKWADAKYETKYFVIAGILLAITLSSYMIYRKIKEVMKFMK